MTQPEYRVPLAGSERTALPGFAPLRPASPHSVVDVSVVLRSPAQEASSESLEEMSAKLPGERHYLSREEYASTHGASQSDIDKVLEFAASHGLRVIGVDRAARTVLLRGTVASMSQAFGVNLFIYGRPQGASVEQYRGRTGPVYIPAELDGVIQAVLGLDDRPQARAYLRHRPTFGAAWPHAGAITHTADRVARAYNFPADASGAGQSIAIIVLRGGFVARDLAAYCWRMGIDQPRVSIVSVQGAGNRPTFEPLGPDGDVTLQLEIAATVAPGADLVVYFAPNSANGYYRAVSRAIHDRRHRPTVLSLAWGDAEAGWTPQTMLAFDVAFQAAAAMGVTVCCASGDRGSMDGRPGRLAHTTFPASSPHVLACGGTSLLSNGEETVWNDGPGWGATGGGVSDFFPVPSWQRSVEVPQSVNPNHHFGRGVPDVAANAGLLTGYRLRVHGHETVAGGTSAAVALWAGLIAVLNRRVGAASGYLNPLLYTKLQPTLRSVASGDNDMTARLGAYRAAPGWDPCTGWGTPRAEELASALAAG